MKQDSAGQENIFAVEVSKSNPAQEGEWFPHWSGDLRHIECGHQSMGI